MINSIQNLAINDVFLIADSSPLIALAGVNRLNLLPRLYSRVIAPSAVIDEILAGGQKASGLNFLDRVSWLKHCHPILDLRRLKQLHRAAIQVSSLEAWRLGIC